MRGKAIVPTRGPRPGEGVETTITIATGTTTTGTTGTTTTTTTTTTGIAATTTTTTGEETVAEEVAEGGEIGIEQSSNVVQYSSRTQHNATFHTSTFHLFYGSSR